jgi:hypothetical protein
MVAFAAALLSLAIVTQDKAALRAAPGTAAAVHAQLWQGELLEVRGSRLDHLQVYDHRRERAGFVRATQVRELALTEAEAPQLKAVMRFLRDTSGSEALGIAYVAAYLKAAPAGSIDAEPFDALGVMAQRLAQRAAAVQSAAVAAHIEVVAQYGVKYDSHELRDRVQLCYDGEAFRRVLAMGPAQASPQQRARATLALTRHDCIDASMRPTERRALDRWRAQLLDGLEPAALARLDAATSNRLHLRRAGVWAAIAFDQSRHDEPTQAAAQRALDELAAVDKSELTEDDLPDYSEAAIRVGATRWAAVPSAAQGGRLQLRLRPGEPGQTCVQLIDTQAKAAAPLAQRCTYATVWAASAKASPDGRALTVAVQPIEGWSELWLWHRQGADWGVDVLPPTSAGAGLGYAEFAGWVQGGSRRLLLVREARTQERWVRRFEQVSTESLVAEKSAGSAQGVAGFGQWADVAWRSGTLSLR